MTWCSNPCIYFFITLQLMFCSGAYLSFLSVAAVAVCPPNTSKLHGFVWIVFIGCSMIPNVELPMKPWFETKHLGVLTLLPCTKSNRASKMPAKLHQKFSPSLSFKLLQGLLLHNFNGQPQSSSQISAILFRGQKIGSINGASKGLLLANVTLPRLVGRMVPQWAW